MTILIAAVDHQVATSGHVAHDAPGMGRAKKLPSKPLCTMYQRATNSPMTTDTNAIASSKHGQSSTGCGCLCTRYRQRGTMMAGTAKYSRGQLQ